MEFFFAFARLALFESVQPPVGEAVFPLQKRLGGQAAQDVPGDDAVLMPAEYFLNVVRGLLQEACGGKRLRRTVNAAASKRGTAASDEADGAVTEYGPKDVQTAPCDGAQRSEKSMARWLSEHRREAAGGALDAAYAEEGNHWPHHQDYGSE